MIKSARKLLNILYIVHFAPCLSLRRFGSGTEARHTRAHTGVNIFAYVSVHFTFVCMRRRTRRWKVERNEEEAHFRLKNPFVVVETLPKRFRSSFRIVLILSFAHRPFTVTGVVKRFIGIHTFDSLTFKEALFMEAFTIESRKQVPGKRLKLF